MMGTMGVAEIIRLSEVKCFKEKENGDRTR